MNDLLSTVDWSRAQFALTAMYHWLFVPLTIGLSLIVAIMETIYVRTGQERWKAITRFWMTLFGINFACGVATGIILEFEFGTNWSNYSWFVGDIFGAPLAIEGIAAFFLESTFVAVMFFGWNKFSRGFHLAATWLTCAGVSLSALWILIANAWMQSPVGMAFDPDQMRNVMDDFWAVVFSGVAVNKFLHTVFSGWTLGAVFVCGVASWLIWRRRRVNGTGTSAMADALSSLKVGGWVGLAGILLTIWTGDGSAVEVSRTQPMKLAAMEGLWRGDFNQDLVTMGILDPDKRPGDGTDGFLAQAPGIPSGLSLLTNRDASTFVPGIEDIMAGVSYDAQGQRVNTVSYADRIVMGRQAQQALRDYDAASRAADTAAMADARARLMKDYRFFGYGYLTDPAQAIPPVGLTFYAFRVMVIIGGYLLVLFLAVLLMAYGKIRLLQRAWFHWVAVLSIPLVWICSQAGWIVAEVGRQPWTIQDILPVQAAISDVTAASVEFTFWVFAVLFTVLLAAEVSIMLRYIGRTGTTGIAHAK